MSGRSAVNAPCFAGVTPLAKALSGISPVSHIKVPLGCTMRKQGVTILEVASSPGLNPMESPFATVIFPQSRTYRRSDLGGAGFPDWASPEGGIDSANNAAATHAPLINRLIMVARISQYGRGASSPTATPLR